MVLVTVATGLGAQFVETAKTMALRTVMEKFGRDMQAIIGAISKEEWALAAEFAPKLAKHAEPPLAEMMRILTWLGTDAGRFLDFDGQVQDAATAMISNIYQLVQARYNGGAADYTIMFDAQHGYLQARRDLVGREGRLSMRYV